MDEVVKSALLSFADEALDGSWSGKGEHEAVSLFTFGYLLGEVRGDGPLYDPTQIGIEFRIPNVPKAGTESFKKKIRKDIVIWPAPRMTCWDGNDEPTEPPSAVLEWKYRKNGMSRYDVEFLKRFTGRYPTATGYAVTANSPGMEFTLSCTRVEEGKAQPQWLFLE